MSKKIDIKYACGCIHRYQSLDAIHDATYEADKTICWNCGKLESRAEFFAEFCNVEYLSGLGNDKYTMRQSPDAILFYFSCNHFITIFSDTFKLGAKSTDVDTIKTKLQCSQCNGINHEEAEYVVI